ncbi:unnamed protein product, partial [Durusdinium trenchii]
RNQSTGFSGEGLCAPRSDGERARQSRVTQGHLEMGEAGLGGREGTPERRAPGQVVRANLRPKDHLSGGCIASDRQEHPLALPRKAGSGVAGTGSGGPVHLVAGPNGLVPTGPEEVNMPQEVPRSLPEGYKPVWG